MMLPLVAGHTYLPVFIYSDYHANPSLRTLHNIVPAEPILCFRSLNLIRQKFEQVGWNKFTMKTRKGKTLEESTEADFEILQAQLSNKKALLCE